MVDVRICGMKKVGGNGRRPRKPTFKEETHLLSVLLFQAVPKMTKVDEQYFKW